MNELSELAEQVEVLEIMIQNQNRIAGFSEQANSASSLQQGNYLLTFIEGSLIIGDVNNQSYITISINQRNIMNLSSIYFTGGLHLQGITSEITQTSHYIAASIYLVI